MLRRLSYRPPARAGRLLLIDLSGLHPATATGIDALSGVVQDLRTTGHDVRLADPQPLVRTALFLAEPPAWRAV